ncbi:MAG: hypothetical protein AAGK37_07725 [Pseudomonadota bacterium]
MAILEPAMSETVGAALALALRDASVRAIALGILRRHVFRRCGQCDRAGQAAFFCDFTGCEANTV